jgi:crotonobetainyl-CoA:carnitine CoA-transferase CaiB-like acyl-CoA transferase
MARPEGAALIARLAAQADVLVENFKVGGLAKYGLDFATLAARNPRLVYCSITGFGQTGPYKDRGGYDFVAQGMGGFMSVTGEAGGQPLRAGVAMADLSTGMYAAVSILVALRHAEATGQGQHIDLSLLDTQIAALANQGMSYLVSGKVPGRMGNRHPTVVPYKTFDVADGTIIIAVGNDGQFRLLCDELGFPELGTDPRFATSAARLVNRDEIERVVQDAVAHLAGDALIDRLSARGIPAGPVNSLDRLYADPFITARGVLGQFDRHASPPIPSVAYPGKLSATPASARVPPPYIGEHTRILLAEWLGCSNAELDDLETTGIIRQGRHA